MPFLVPYQFHPLLSITFIPCSPSMLFSAPHHHQLWLLRLEKIQPIEKALRFLADTTGSAMLEAHREPTKAPG